METADKTAIPDGWDWFETDSRPEQSIELDSIAISFARSFADGDGEIVLRHLRRIILDRRLGPESSDAELRYLEGQRSVVAHILSMIDRGRG